VFRHAGFRESWSANSAAEVSAGKGRPRALLDACGARIRWGLRSDKVHDAREAAGGHEFALDTQSRLLIQDSRRCELITRLPKELVPEAPGAKVTLVLDSPTALEGFRQQGGKLWIPFDLGLPAGAAMHYQPELTRQELDEGCLRPPLVVGSFAIYGPCDGGTKHWNAGKLGHLYRPFVIDLKGAWTWAEWVLEAGNLWATIPLAWLQSAERQWPILLDPYFGYTDGGASYRVLYTANQYGIGPYAAPVDIDEITHIGFSCHTGTANARVMGVWDDAGGSAPTNPVNLLAQTGEDSTNSSDAWIDVALAAPYGATGGVAYWLGGQIAADSTNVIHYDTVTNADVSRAHTYDATLIGFATHTHGNYARGFRATYTATAAGHPTIKRFGGVPFAAGSGKGVW